MRIVGCTNKGLNKLNNEDCIIIGDKIFNNDSEFNVISSDIFTFLVFDGVGGNNAGEIASYTAAEFFSNKVSLKSQESIVHNIQVANNTIIEKSMQKLEYKNMATTIAGISINENDFISFNVGDSRVYRYRQGVLHQFTKDHTYYQELLDKGVSNDISFKYKNSHIITKCLGIYSLLPEDININYVENGVLPEDIFIICTDGITDMVTDDEINNITDSCESANQIYEKIIKMVHTNGAKDNYSLIIIQI